jgi:hypothetical protein
MAICIVQMIQTTGSVRASRTCSHLNCLFWWEVARARSIAANQEQLVSGDFVPEGHSRSRADARPA